MNLSSRRRLDGVLLLDKPLGVSSNGALQRARRIFGAAKAGHTGTLDPLASGLLPICFGEATKFSSLMLESEKSYRAVVKLGETTATGDAEGEILERKPVSVNLREIEEALSRFLGKIEQIPPIYSALKHKGRPLYEYARAGQEVERMPRSVTIEELVLEKAEEDEIQIFVRCSKGTYIRVLAEDIGKALGCGAHLKGLRRTGTGHFRIEDAHRLEELESMDARDGILLPCDALLSGFGKIELEEDAAEDLQNGRQLENQGSLSGIFRLYGVNGRFFGLIEAGCGKIKSKRMMSANY